MSESEFEARALLGREGGHVPVFLVFYRRGTEEIVGYYSRLSSEPAKFMGPMFRTEVDE